MENMANLTCICGAALNYNQADSNDIQFRVYTDKQWDVFLTPDYIKPGDIPLPTYDVRRCPLCERVNVFEWGNSKAVKVYCLEED